MATTKVTKDELEFGGPWIDWVPTWTNVSGGTLNFAKYIQIGKTVHFKLEYQLAGAGVAGTVSFTLPSTIISGMELTNPIGTATFLDNGVAIYGGVVLATSTTSANLRAVKTDAAWQSFVQLSSTVPFTWGSTDKLMALGTYEVA